MLRAALLVALVGCATGRVPAAVRGNDTVVIANEMAAPLCTLVLTADASSTQDWLDGTIVRPFEREGFDIKPGRYRVEATTCGTHERATGFIDVRHAMVVAIGAWREPAPAYIWTGVVPAVVP